MLRSAARRKKHGGADFGTQRLRELACIVGAEAVECRIRAIRRYAHGAVTRLVACPKDFSDFHYQDPCFSTF
jgi:hypothetical protein